jgi:hypothetical protein
VNSFNGKIKKINNVIKSLKEEPNHGIGLSSINETVSKYNGDVNFKFAKNRFEITIVMCTSMPTKVIA